MSDTPPRSAFVTGALGFIGRRVVERLRADGADVVGVDLRPSTEPGMVAGDLAEADPWQARAAGAEVVVHTAAVVSNVATDLETWRGNVLATRRVLDAAVAAGAKRFVHLSSVRAFGDLGFPDGVDESWPVRPDGNRYVDTKIASEQVVLQAHAAGEIEVVVVRPGDVYGPGSRPWTILPLEMLRSNRFVLPARGKGIFSPVYVDDLVDGLALCCSHPGAAGQVLTLSGGVGVACAEFFGHYARMLGKSGVPSVPTSVAVGLAEASGRFDRARGSASEASAGSARYLARTGTYSIDKARARIGYAPKVGLDEGMRRTEAWLRDEGLL